MSVPNGSENRFFRNQTDQFQLRGADGRTLPDYGKASDLAEGRKHTWDSTTSVTKPILSVSYLCENGTEIHLARDPFLKYGDQPRTPDQENGVYFVKAQIVHKVKGTIESCVRAGDSQESRVRAGESQKTCVQARNSQSSRVRAGESPKSCARPKNSSVQAEGLQILEKTCF